MNLFYVFLVGIVIVISWKLFNQQTQVAHQIWREFVKSEDERDRRSKTMTSLQQSLNQEQKTRCRLIGIKVNFKGLVV